MNNGIEEKDIQIEQHMNGYYLRFFDKKFNKSEENMIQLKDKILNNQAIVDALQKDLKETEESFLEAKDDVNRRILDYHSVMVKAVLRETYHSNCTEGTK